ncbi:uncharacterized protein LOC111614886 isoform X1 [Centruroides sculpturatus]|uniref:uncharacterized protein LOC111614886 isoform X1 n=2 Tax=Centruroides sculpturatus TaxID=218467 RepID=UPI000C6D4626|nr:uncharacterized protein LOC111614886 isoform X1 [Centruroides sculpturatus]
MEEQEVICFSCAISPLGEIIRFYGIDCFEICAHLSVRSTKTFKIYSIILECILWIKPIMHMLIMLFRNSNIGMPCGSWFNEFSEDKIIFVGYTFIIHFTLAAIFSICRRKLLILTLKRTSYVGEKEIIKRFIRAFLNIQTIIIIFFVVINSYHIITKRYFKISKIEGETMALICTTFMVTNNCLMFGYAIVIITIFFLILTTIKHRFLALSEELQHVKNDPLVYKKLELIIIKHTELTEQIQHLNDYCENSLFLIYNSIIWFYALSFSIINVVRKWSIIYALIVICFLVIGVTTWLYFIFMISTLSSAVYGSFQEIRKFSYLQICITKKLKILNFMKQFKGTSLGISCGNFFVFTRKTPVKMAKALESSFSIISNLRNPSKHCSNSRIKF